MQKHGREEKRAEQYSLFFIQRFKGKVLFNVSMSEHTSWRIGGPADVMAFPKDEGDLKDIITFAEAKGFPYFILGAGTNLLVRDGGIRGIVINMTEGFKDVAFSGVKAVSGAGVPLVSLVNECAGKGLTGLEFACSIPGTVGGAVVMNAGAYGGELKDTLAGVEVLDRKGKISFVPATELELGYRRSSLPKGTTVVRAHFTLKEAPPDEIKERIRGFRERRKGTSGVGHPSAGSVFKNPEGNFAGRLIEEAGLKGERLGGAEVSSVHANYIVNIGGAKAKEVLKLMALVRDKVYSRTGMLLEPEIKVVGED